MFFVAWRRAWLLDNLPLRNRPHNNHCHRMYHRIHHRAHHHSDDAFWKRNIPEVLESCIGNDLPEQNGIRRSRKIFGECGCVLAFFRSRRRRLRSNMRAGARKIKQTIRTVKIPKNTPILSMPTSITEGPRSSTKD